jgi:hypothetical protein
VPHKNFGGAPEEIRTPDYVGSSVAGSRRRKQKGKVDRRVVAYGATMTVGALAATVRVRNGSVDPVGR